MSELVKYETQSGLTFKQQVTYSQQHSLIKDTDDDLLNNVINIALGKCIQLTGFKFPNEADYDFLLSEMVKDVKSNAKGLRMSEISIAFERGIKKVYGEWVGISVVTFSGFIRAYIKDPERLEIMKSLEPEKKEIEPKKWDGTARYNELKAQFKETGHCEDTGNLVYDWMMETGKLPEKYGSRFYLQAKEQLMKEKKTKLITELNTVERLSIDKSIKAIESNSSQETIVLAKKIAINLHFLNELQRG